MILNIMKCLKFLLLITFVTTIIAISKLFVISSWSLTNINNDNVYQPTVHCDVSSRIADDLYYGGPWLSTVHISIKSTENYPISRLPVLRMTWLQTVPPKNVNYHDGLNSVINFEL